VLVGKLKKVNHMGEPWHIREDNIKIDFKESKGGSRGMHSSGSGLNPAWW
jgi:hypothetical protein